MSWEKDIANRVIGRVKRLASDACALIAGKRRGAHSAPAADERAMSADGAAYKRGAHSMPPAADGASARTARPARSRSSRGAHTVRSRAPRVVSARGAHSARPARPVRPALNSFSPRLAPATARGYSMAEVLATVAIILILASIVVMNVISFQANLRQKELDAKAEIIYTAAQEQMTRIMASGRESVLAEPNKGNINGFVEPTPGTVCEYVTPAGVRFIPTEDAIPGDKRQDGDNADIEDWQICYISSRDLNTENSATKLLFGAGGLEDELLNNHWIIEYDCKSLTVHAVYYSENFDITNENENGYGSGSLASIYDHELRNYSFRLKSDSYLKDGRRLGYHGGGSSSSSVSYSLDPTIQVTNAEKLVATIKCTKPLISEHLSFLVTLEDSFGNTNRTYYCINSEEADEFPTGSSAIPVRISAPLDGRADTNAVFSYSGLDYTLTLTLDSLEEKARPGKDETDALRFKKLYGSQSDTALELTTNGNKALVEGSDITIKVQVVCKKNPLVETGYAGYTEGSAVTVNSLFDDATDVGKLSDNRAGTAGISCGRHLQNLDSDSGIVGAASNITTAEQHANINFDKVAGGGAGDEDFKGWASTYGKDNAAGAASYFNEVDAATGKPRFKPIVNSQLTSYNGKPSAASADDPAFTIAHLNINEEEDAGLFASISGGSDEAPITLQNIVLTGSTIKGGSSQSLGGLVAVNSGKLTIQSCQLYLNKDIDLLGMRPSSDPAGWLVGGTVGGLVGTNSGSLNIINSSASTVAHGSSVAGGLVGSNIGGASALVIKTSYADCYLKAHATGGLVASGSAKVSASYSAGYLGGTDSSSTAAGLVNGGGSITNSYTVCSTYGSIAPQYYWMTPSEDGATLTNVHYLKTGVKDKVQGDIPDSMFNDKSTPPDTGLTVLNFFEGQGTSFTLNEQGSSTAYNLMDQGLDSYTWPSISKVPHYGDWEAGFLQGSLVYFEKYRIVNAKGKGAEYCYGFAGANVKSTLVNVSSFDEDEAPARLWRLDGGTWESISGSGKRIIVVGDGYGVVYKNDSPTSGAVTVQVPNSGERSTWVTLDAACIDIGNFYSVKSPSDADANTGDTYKLYPLDLENVDGYSTHNSDTSAVNSDSFYLSATIDNDHYFFNPHFAKTVTRAGASEMPNAPKAGSYIYLRTGRHLNNLSRFYEKSGDGSEAGYRKVTEGCVFYQERDIAFTDYEWAEFAKRPRNTIVSSSNPNELDYTYQAPIGSDENRSFTATYNGGCHMITDVSFKTRADYAGMFGYVSKDAEILNVVLCTDFIPTAQKDASETEGEALESLKHNYYVQREIDAASTSGEVHMGVLAGYNCGSISNCATAGYFLAGSDGTVHAYTGSVMHLGGLVGTNTGSIENCSADSPKLRLSLYQTNAYAAGFVGTNEGNIGNCYALGAIDVVEASSSTASIAGFAGQNQGQISDSYCATAVASSGLETVVNGFAPAGGRVWNCQFLNGGTYTYVARMYAFNFNTDKSKASGNPIRYEALKVAVDSEDYVDEDHSFVHSQTKTVDGNDRYPYRGIVKDANEAFVHYGNWQDDVVLGDLGVFYWELEENSANGGYHMTFLGSRDYEDNGTWKTEFSSGTSLCNSHDDDGVITQYGYGVYVRSGWEKKASFKWSGIACGSDGIADSSGFTSMDTLNLNDEGRFNREASRDLQEQMKNNSTGTGAEYRFFAFTTRPHKSDSDPADYLYLSENTGNQPNGSVSLKFASDSGEETIYTYAVSPFFANALSLENVEQSNGPDPSLKPTKLMVSAADDREIDCLLDPGNETLSTGDKPEGNHYEIRSLQQLQYINWNANAQNTTQLVTKEVSNYKCFPYLQYTTNLNGSSQTRTQAQEVRPARSWLQTHDVSNAEHWNSNGDSFFSPIAGAATSSSYNNYDAVLPAWFGGSYNGQSYTVRNVSIKSRSFYVGLFGATAGAEIRNIILRGDSDDAAVVRDTQAKDGYGAYFIGGLVGLALNYFNDDTDKTITNCAISGYRVVDSSRNQQGKGEVCIGGLIGVANVNLKNCSAVTKIDVSPDYKNLFANDGGNYIRVGGLVGSLLDTIENCYTGGSIAVGTEVLNNVYNDSTQLDMHSNNQVYWGKGTRIFLAGIAGSAFSSAIKNFGITVNNNASDLNQMKIYNSYTYMDFPTMTGTIYSISMIASLADRHSFGITPDIDNCYYLESSAAFGYDLPNYYYCKKNGAPVRLGDLLSSEGACQAMIDGDVSYLADYLGEFGYNNNGKPSTPITPPPAAPEKLTYGQMICSEAQGSGNRSFDDLLNNGSETATKPQAKPTNVWAPVTSEDTNGVPIDGKYSFPSDEALDGLNFPFPTVVTQTDLTFGEQVHVHYGDWPVNGSYWAKGRDSMDIFSDMELTGGVGLTKDWAYKTFELYVDTQKYNNPTPVISKEMFSLSSSGYASIESVSQLEGEGRIKKCQVTIKALQEGFVTVTFSNGVESGISFALRITANWELSAEGVGNTVFDSVSNTLRIREDNTYTAQIQLKAHDLSGEKDFTKSKFMTWDNPKPTVDNDNLSLVDNSDDPSLLKATRVNSGVSVVTVTGTYSYNGQKYTRQLFITAELPGIVGLSNAVEGAGHDYCEVTVGGKDLAGKPVIDFGADKPVPNPAFSAPVNFYLYTPSNDGYLKNPGNIVSVTIGSETIVPGEYKRGDAYYVELNSATTSDGNYTCLGGALYYVSTGPKSDVTITVHLQGGYTLETTIPWDKVTQAMLFRLTLDNGDPTVAYADKPLYVVKTPGTNQVPGYDRSKLETKAGWQIEGWYFKEGDTYTKVLDADGKVDSSCTDKEGVIEDGCFVRKGEAILHAKWVRYKEAWVLANSLEYGKEYIMVDANTVDANASTFFQSSKVDNSGHQRGTYLTADNVTVQSDNGYTYVLGEFDDSYKWDFNSFREGVGGFKNKGTEFLLAENDDNVATDRWALLAVKDDDNALKDRSNNTKYDRARLMISTDSSNNNKVDAKGALRTLTEVNIYHFPGTHYLLAGVAKDKLESALSTDAQPVYPYVHSNVPEMTFEYYPELTLMNGGTRAGSRALSEEISTVSGKIAMPSNSNGWELLGWYDSKLKDAQKVLEATGNVVAGTNVAFAGGSVSNGALSLNNNATLYAKWRRKTTAYAETTELDEDTEYVITETSGALRNDNGTVRILRIPVDSYGYQDIDGNLINTIPNVPSDVKWTQYEQTKFRNNKKYLKVSEDKTLKIWKLGTDSSSNKGIDFLWDSSKKTLSFSAGNPLVSIRGRQQGRYSV